MLSRNNFPSITQISSAVEQSLMKKLNKKKIKWIVKEVERRETGLYTIAKTQNITPRWAREVHKKFRKREPEFKKCGRKLREITNEERKIVKQTYEEFQVGATMIEQILDEKGIHINHNRIHRIMLEEGLAKREQKKSRRRKWVRYERKHSNSLWHTDWFEYNGKQCIIYIDDASRFMVSYGEFSNANAVNSIKVLNEGLRFGKPKQIMSDHGTQFVSVNAEGKEQGISQFGLALKELGIKHIKARVKHPQSNGKAERAVGTMKRLWERLGSLEKTVKHYNYKRPHRSLTNGKLRTPYQAFLEKQRK